MIVKNLLNQEKYDFDGVEISLLVSASMISTYSLADAAFLFSLKKDLVSFWAAVAGLGGLCSTIYFFKGAIGEDAVAFGVFVAAALTWLIRRLSVDSIRVKLN